MMPVLPIFIFVLSFYGTAAMRDDAKLQSTTNLPSVGVLKTWLLEMSEDAVAETDEVIQNLVRDLKQTVGFVKQKRLIELADQTKLEEWWVSAEEKKKTEADLATRKARGGKPKCVAAFDFDQNLIRSHCTSTMVGDLNLIKERVWSDSNDEPNSFTRLIKIKKMFKKLEAAGCKVVVITRNLKDYVDQALAAASLQVMEVVGQKEFDNGDGTAHKGAWLRKNLLEPWGFQAPFNEVIFSDDDSVNTEEVSTSLEGAMILQPTNDLCMGDADTPFIGPCEACKDLPGCPNGLSIADIDKIIQWAQAIS